VFPKDVSNFSNHDCNRNKASRRTVGRSDGPRGGDPVIARKTRKPIGYKDVWQNFVSTQICM